MRLRSESVDDKLDRYMRAHFEKYVGIYEARVKGSPEPKRELSLLEQRVDPKDQDSNHLIDRVLLADYLTLKLSRANNAVQKWTAFLAGVSVVMSIVALLFGLEVLS